MSNSCNFLQGTCILQTAVEARMLSRKFYNDELNEMITADGDIKMVPYDTQADETSKVLLSMVRGPLSLTNAGIINNPSNVSSMRPALSIVFTISSQSYRLTELLGLELAQYIASISTAIGAFNLNISTIQLTETQVNTEASPHFYINKVVVQASIPQINWKLESSDDILNSIRTNFTFNGQKI